MTTIRQFEHDGSNFEVRAILADEIWKVGLFCDGNLLGDHSVVPNEAYRDALRQGTDLLDAAAGELESEIRKMHGLTVEKHR